MASRLDRLQVLPDDALAEPLQWEDVCEAIATHRLATFRRASIPLAAYRAFRERILQTHTSMNDFVYQQVLGLPATRDSATGRWSVAHDTSEAQAPRTCFVPNHFPYHLAEGIHHHVLWCLGQPLTEDLIRRELALHRNPLLYDVQYFVNPPELRSVDGVPHCHVLSRLRAYATVHMLPALQWPVPDAAPVPDASSSSATTASTATSTTSVVVTLEVCVDSPMSARAAEAGGACRIELCSALSEGGLTPTPALVAAVVRSTRLPVHVMLRCRAGDFCYSAEELAIMEQDCNFLKGWGVAGFVFGALLPDGQVDLEATRRIVAAAYPLPITFHRAIDMCRDPVAAAVALRDVGIPRILTSGGESTALEGSPMIRAMVEAVGQTVQVVPGGGITERNVARIVQSCSVSQVHASARKTHASCMSYTNARVVMGASLIASEYELKQADSERVHRLVAEANSAGSPNL